jgi:hypothetical protein
MAKKQQTIMEMIRESQREPTRLERFKTKLTRFFKKKKPAPLSIPEPPSPEEERPKKPLGSIGPIEWNEEDKEEEVFYLFDKDDSKAIS